MSAISPTGFGGPTTIDTNALTSMPSLPPAEPPKPDWMQDNTIYIDGRPACATNGTKGRVHTEELRADNRTPQQRAADEAAFQKALADSKAGPSLGITSMYAGASGAGFDVSGKINADGSLGGDYAIPTAAPGVTTGTKGAGYSLGADVPKVYAGVCIGWVGKKGEEKKPRVQTEADASGGIFQGSWDGNELCGGLQTPAPPSAGGFVKINP
jgi:hypothetical protein